MGFDVCAYCADAGSDISSKDQIDRAFAEAARWVIEHAHGVDGFLELGSLDCGGPIQRLQEAIGRKIDPNSMGIWLAEEVRQLAEAAQWADPSTIAQEDLWEYWSARKFLEVCVTHGLRLWTV